MLAQPDKIRDKRNKKPILFLKNQLAISATKYLLFTDIEDILCPKFKSISLKIKKRDRFKNLSFSLLVNYHHLSKNKYFITSYKTFKNEKYELNTRQ